MNPNDSIEWIRFDTPIGRCGIAWRGDELVGTQLPERDERATLARMRRRWPGGRESGAPVSVQATIAQIVALLEGRPADFEMVRLALVLVPDFHRQVYQITRSIPRGQTLTYGDVARRLGDVTLARAVGQALGQNPWPLVVPCHRVIAADRRPGGFSGGEGTATKLRLLAIEGAVLDDQPTLFD